MDVNSRTLLPYNAKVRVHWDGQRWSNASIWDPGTEYSSPSSELHGIAAVTPTNIWAVGGTGGYEEPHASIDHYACQR